MRFLFYLLCCLSISLFADVSVLSLGNLGSVRYFSDDQHLLQIERLSSSDEVMYTHSYQYDETGKLISESLIGDLGDVFYDDTVVRSPFSLEICEYDENHNLVRYTLDGITREFSYNEVNQMIIEDTEQFHEYDTFGNVISIGNDGYIYDEANNLIQVITPDCIIDYAYDSYGNRISRTLNEKTEYYIYQGINEIAIVGSDGAADQLRIPGLSTHNDIFRPRAIETKNGIYAPIHDVQGNIIRLIDIATREVISIDGFDPYGKGLPNNAPTAWIFSGKHYDAEADLVYFGSRYYSPELRQWLTPDPLMQTSNPYQYCLDNPFSYVDPNGEWAFTLLTVAWGAGATITAPIWAPYAAATALGMTVGYYGYKAYGNWKEDSNKEQEYWNGEKSGYKMDAHKAKDGKQKDGIPKSNGAQNDQVDGACKEIEKKIGKKLDKDDREVLHRHISGQGYGYHEIVEEGVELFK